MVESDVRRRFRYELRASSDAVPACRSSAGEIRAEISPRAGRGPASPASIRAAACALLCPEGRDPAARRCSSILAAALPAATRSRLDVAAPARRRGDAHHAGGREDLSRARTCRRNRCRALARRGGAARIAAAGDDPVRRRRICGAGSTWTWPAMPGCIAVEIWSSGAPHGRDAIRADVCTIAGGCAATASSILAEELRLEGDISRQLDRPAFGSGARAATALYVGERCRDDISRSCARACRGGACDGGASAWNGHAGRPLLGAPAQRCAAILLSRRCSASCAGSAGCRASGNDNDRADGSMHLTATRKGQAADRHGRDGGAPAPRARRQAQSSRSRRAHHRFRRRRRARRAQRRRADARRRHMSSRAIR